MTKRTKGIYRIVFRYGETVELMFYDDLIELAEDGNVTKQNHVCLKYKGKVGTTRGVNYEDLDIKRLRDAS